MKNESRFPPSWDEERVRSVLEYYESQTEDEAVAEDEAAYEDNPHYAMIEIPRELVPAVMELISKHDAELEARKATVGGDRDDQSVRESQRRSS